VAELDREPFLSWKILVLENIHLQLSVLSS